MKHIPATTSRSRPAISSPSRTTVLLFSRSCSDPAHQKPWNEARWVMSAVTLSQWFSMLTSFAMISRYASSSSMDGSRTGQLRPLSMSSITSCGSCRRLPFPAEAHTAPITVTMQG